jgi:hypothetical protein
MPEIVVVGSFTAQEGKETEDLFADGGDIVVYEAVPGGQTTKGSIAAHAAG